MKFIKNMVSVILCVVMFIQFSGVVFAEDAPLSKSEGSISIPGYMSISLKANQLDQLVSLRNPERNDCYFIISMYLPDGTKIFESEMVSPGHELCNIKLNQEVQPGTYRNSILGYKCYGMDEALTRLNSANLILTLDVK